MPNPNYCQDYQLYCSKYFIDVENNTDACEVNGGMGNTCASCPCCEKQHYTLVTRNEDQKHLISPRR
jgi:hypothetical protein